MERKDGFIIVVRGDVMEEDDFCNPLRKISGDVEQLDHVVTEMRKGLDAGKTFIRLIAEAQNEKLKNLTNRLAMLENCVADLGEMSREVKLLKKTIDRLEAAMNTHLEMEHGQK